MDCATEKGTWARNTLKIIEGGNTISKRGRSEYTVKDSISNIKIDKYRYQANPDRIIPDFRIKSRINLFGSQMLSWKQC